MKITCTGPRGEKFEATGAMWTGEKSEVDSLCRQDRDAMQKALETWCKAVEADRTTARAEGDTLEKIHDYLNPSSRRA